MQTKLITSVFFFFMVTAVPAQFKNPKNVFFTWKTETLW